MASLSIIADFSLGPNADGLGGGSARRLSGVGNGLFALVGAHIAGHRRGTGVECGGVKFLILGLFGSGLVLFATALLYGAAGDTGLQLLVESLSSPVVDDKLVVSAVVLLLAGLFLKLGAAPVTLGHPTCVKEARSRSQSLSPPRVLRRWGASCFMFCSRSKICGCPCWKPRRC